MCSGDKKWCLVIPKFYGVIKLVRISTEILQGNAWVLQGETRAGRGDCPLTSIVNCYLNCSLNNHSLQTAYLDENLIV